MVTEPLLNAANFDPTKLTWLGTITSETSVCATWKTSPVKTWDDMFKREFSLGGSAVGADPDTFALFLVNPTTGATFPTADPTGADALFLYSIGNANQPATFCLTTAPCVLVTPVVVAAAPEPAGLALVGAALLALTIARSRRRQFVSTPPFRT
jgi:hypothetical protein